MKQQLALLAILFLNFTAISQDWSTRTTTPENYSFGYGLDETEDGFISIGSDSLYDDYTAKILVAKYSRCGDIIWENMLNPYGASTAVGGSITYLSDGNYAGTGLIATDSIYIFKMNPDGDLIWENIILSPYYLTAGGQIKEDSDGNLILMTSQYLFKCNELGEVLWDIDFYGDDNINCYQFQPDGDNNIFVTGIDLVTGDSKLIKCDETGSIEFTKDTYFYTFSIAHLGSQIVLGGTLGQDGALRFFDLDGDTINTHIIPYNTDDDWLVENADVMQAYLLKIEPMENENLAIRINYSGYGPFPWVKPYVIEYDYSAESIINEDFISDLSISAIFPTFSSDVVGTFDEGYAAIGASHSEDDDDIQMTLWKFNDDCTLNLESHTQNELTVYPNPASDYLEINTSEEIKSVHIYNMEGRLSHFTTSVQNNRMDLSELPTGIYILKIETATKISHIRLVKN